MIPEGNSPSAADKQFQKIDSIDSVTGILWDFGNEALYLLPQSQMNLWMLMHS